MNSPAKIPGSAQDVARAFCRILCQWLTPEEIAEIARLNRVQQDPNICHSHDFCDPNEAMDLAMHECNIEQIDPVTEEHLDSGLECWNSAWDIAKAAEFDVARIA